MKAYLKPTCIILGAQLMFVAGVISQPVIKNYFTTEAQTAQAYDTKGLANMANAHQYVDIPQKPLTEGVY